jgi:5-carboxymethyl-2-hydroxymuconate isomerase
MPHITLEYSDNLCYQKDFDIFFSQIHKMLEEKAGINPINCKSRAISLDKYYVGEGDEMDAFAHLELAIFEGRKTEVLQEIGNEILWLMQFHLSDKFTNQKAQYTLEIREFKKEHYFKA